MLKNVKRERDDDLLQQYSDPIIESNQMKSPFDFHINYRDKDIRKVLCQSLSRSLDKSGNTIINNDNSSSPQEKMNSLSPSFGDNSPQHDVLNDIRLDENTYLDYYSAIDHHDFSLYNNDDYHSNSKEYLSTTREHSKTNENNTHTLTEIEYQKYLKMKKIFDNIGEYFTHINQEDDGRLILCNKDEKGMYEDRHNCPSYIDSTGKIFHVNDQNFHNQNGPARISPKSIDYMKNGLFQNDKTLPARSGPSGMLFYENGKLDNPNGGPVLITNKGKCYFKLQKGYRPKDTKHKVFNFNTKIENCTYNKTKFDNIYMVEIDTVEIFKSLKMVKIPSDKVNDIEKIYND